ncbi:substrate-binding domain-containing protein [Streptomyces sp. NBC_00828]|uniref:substrate-binding domain-containing protein n=1 Tax=Streptomyces sp. NBC_00828 TaxID=2903678 RepID=UPI0038697341
MAAGTTHPRAISVGCTTLARFSVRTGAVRSYVQGLDEELTDHDHVLLVRHGHSAPEATQKILPLTEALLGFAQEAARRLGLPPLERFVVPRPREAGAAAVETFLAAHPDVTALAAFDDDIALRSLTALRDPGRRAPEDVAVIGFDEAQHSSDGSAPAAPPFAYAEPGSVLAT